MHADISMSVNMSMDMGTCMHTHIRMHVCTHASFHLRLHFCLVGKDDLEKATMKQGAGGFWVGYFKDGTEFETMEPNVRPLSEDLIGISEAS